MRKCCGNNTQDWGADAIFDLRCETSGQYVEFFQDEITRHCPRCRQTIHSNRRDYGCGQWCSSSSLYPGTLCPKFKRSKERFYRHAFA